MLKNGRVHTSERASVGSRFDVESCNETMGIGGTTRWRMGGDVEVCVALRLREMWLSSLSQASHNSLLPSRSGQRSRSRDVGSGETQPTIGVVQKVCRQAGKQARTRQKASKKFLNDVAMGMHYRRCDAETSMRQARIVDDGLDGCRWFRDVNQMARGAVLAMGLSGPGNGNSRFRWYSRVKCISRYQGILLVFVDIPD